MQKSIYKCIFYLRLYLPLYVGNKNNAQQVHMMGNQASCVKLENWTNLLVNIKIQSVYL